MTAYSYLPLALAVYVSAVAPACQRRDGKTGDDSSAYGSPDSKAASARSARLTPSDPVVLGADPASSPLGTEPPPRQFLCPECARDGEEAPVAHFGGATSVRKAPSAAVPPGAPAAIEYARLKIEEHFSGFDVPLFLSLSSLADGFGGRRATFTVSSDAGPQVLFDCMLKGGLVDEIPKEAKPDPLMSPGSDHWVRELRNRDGDRLHYQRSLYVGNIEDVGNVEHWVSCRMAQEYAGYFLPIAEDMGASIMVTGGIGPQDLPGVKSR